MYTMQDIEERQDKRQRQMRIALKAPFTFLRRLTNVGLRNVLNHGSPTRGPWPFSP